MALLCSIAFKGGRLCSFSAFLSRNPPGLSLRNTTYRESLQICCQPKAKSVRFRVLSSSLSLTRPVHSEPTPIQCWHRFHTSARVQALPAPLIWMVLKPLQKIMAIILGRSIRKWWTGLPSNRQQLLRKWAWQTRWKLAAVAGVAMVTVALFLLTHLDETPVTGRTRLLVIGRQSCLELADQTSKEYMEEFAELLVPKTDPRYQLVEQVLQHLAQRNKDIPEVSDFTWNVHVVQSPNINAFVLPNGTVFIFTGMLEALSDIHQLTVVLGHEVAHAVLGHNVEKASLSHVLDLLSVILLTAIWAVCPRDSLALLGQWVQNKLTQLLFSRPYSRKLEAEADQVGLLLAAKACADVRAGPVFWQQMEIRDKLNREATVPEWLSTHPSHKNRVTQLNRLIPQALELRDSCVCPPLPVTDPRATFSKSVQVLLESASDPRRTGPKGPLKPVPSGPLGIPAGLLAESALPVSQNVNQESKGSAPVLASEPVMAVSFPAVEKEQVQSGI